MSPSHRVTADVLRAHPRCSAPRVQIALATLLVLVISGCASLEPKDSQLPAVAGYPHLTVPMGAVEGLPIGLSFIGTAWDDGRVLAAGHAYEQASHARVTPTYRTALQP